LSSTFFSCDCGEKSAAYFSELGSGKMFGTIFFMAVFRTFNFKGIMLRI
jgi:hypothetical protein